MKYVFIYTLFLLPAFLTSCGGQSQPDSPKEIAASPRSDPGLLTRYTYTDSGGKRVVIQNGYPRGGSRYTDPGGEVYGYAIFWTRLINETDHPLELTIDFSQNPYEVPSLPGKYFTILIPPDTMTIDKVPLYSYGLTGLASFLDKNIHKSSSLKRTVNPKESSGFFVLKLSLVAEGLRGGGDVLRTELVLKGHDLFYKVSTYSSASAGQPATITGEKEIHCGSINLKDLKLQSPGGRDN
jgi:hypothetical protein